jgi:hypothetical protein
MSIGLTLTLLFANFTTTLAAFSAQRTRAQLAADSAALAAAVEDTIAGSGRQEGVASRYASLNGAALLNCECENGSGYVRVAVQVGGARAEAEAMVDPSRLGPALGGSGRGKLAAGMESAVARLLDASHGRVQIGSGFRERSEQERLWQAALDKYGDPEIADNWVARPGTSMHEAGLAVDLSGDLAEARRLISELRLPLYQPMSWEPWHFELLGSRS